MTENQKHKLVGRRNISFPVEFHIARSARERYRFSRRLYALSGNVVFSDIQIIREFTEKVNAERQADLHPERAVRAGEVNSIGLIDEIWHFMARRYREQVNPEVLPRARRYLGREIGKRNLEGTLLAFVEEFPGREVYRGKKTPEEYLKSSTKGTDNRDITLEEMMMLSLSNRNPAFRPLRDLFDDSVLRRRSAYGRTMKSLEEFFRSQPGFGPAAYSLLDFLMAPILAAPDSLEGQLSYIREHWGKLLPPSLHRELLVGLDIIKEEEKVRLSGPGPARAPDFGWGMGEEELTILHLPGHSPGHIGIVTPLGLFAGDVLFAGSIGRWDFRGGNKDDLIASIVNKLLVLPDSTTVHPGHGPATTIGEERRSNPFLTGELEL